MLVLVIGVFVTSLLVQEGVIIFQNAAPSDVPENVRITNISDTAFTVTYQTAESVVGTLSLQAKNQNPQTVLDDRDQNSGTPKPYFLHSISAKNLSPNTTYSFSILSNTTTYVNNGQPFSLTTPSTLQNPPSSQIPFAGKVINPDGTQPSETLVFVTTDNGQLLSSLVNSAGLYIIPLNTMRTKDLSAPFAFSSKTVLSVLAINPTLTSHVRIGMDALNPAPQITLSQDYDFSVSSSPIASSSAAVNFPIIDFASSTTATPQITVPKSNENFTDTQPQFTGTAAPNSSVEITIHSSTAITTKVTSNANGDWTYRPTTALTPGQHTITITTTDATGILHTIQQSFTVYAAGTQITSATPSATLAPTQKPTPTPTVVIIKPTSTPTPLPTIAKNAVVSPTIPPRPTLPATGSNAVAIAGLAGIATTVVGIVLFFITSGAAL